jgi:hypothetical protein
VIASRRDAGRSSCSSWLAGASGGQAGWPSKLMSRLAGLSADGVGCRCLLLVNSQLQCLQCSLDVTIAATAVTDANVGGPRGVGAVVVNAGWVALASLWEAHTPSNVGQSIPRSLLPYIVRRITAFS